MGEGSSNLFNSTIGVKQGYLFSSILFGLYIDELEQMVTRFVKEESIEEITIESIIMMLLLYVDDVMLFCKYFRRCTKSNEGLGNVF